MVMFDLFYRLLSVCESCPQIPECGLVLEAMKDPVTGSLLLAGSEVKPSALFALAESIAEKAKECGCEVTSRTASAPSSRPLPLS